MQIHFTFLLSYTSTDREQSMAKKNDHKNKINTCLYEINCK